MGNKFTIEAWGLHDGMHFSMAQVWGGQSVIPALWTLWKTKRAGYGCVTLSWRG